MEWTQNPSSWISYKSKWACSMQLLTGVLIHIHAEANNSQFNIISGYGFSSAIQLWRFWIDSYSEERYENTFPRIELNYPSPLILFGIFLNYMQVQNILTVICRLELHACIDEPKNSIIAFSDLGSTALLLWLLNFWGVWWIEYIHYWCFLFVVLDHGRCIL